MINQLKSKFLIFILSFLLIFSYQSVSWASVKYTEPKIEIIDAKIDKSIFLTDNKTDYISVEQLPNTDLSIFSLFIPGLGQMLMGDFWRGFAFVISFFTGVIAIFYEVTFAFSLLPDLILQNYRGNIIFLIFISWIAILITIGILNIIDADSMARMIKYKRKELENNQNQSSSINRGITFNVLSF